MNVRRNGIVTGGCDVGSTTGKAVVMKDGQIVSYSIISCTNKPELTARIATEEAIKKSGLSSLEDLDYIIGTGYGRLKVTFAKDNISEITCHARGAQWLCPTARTVVDIGGQDCKAMSVNNMGKVIEFVMNDKCAAGTGRFFEAMTRVMVCSINDLSSLSLKSKKPSTITNQCSVFAESEVITLINEGVDLADIAAGINDSIANRLGGLVRRVGLIEDVVVTGGCAKNEGLIKAMEKKFGVAIKRIPIDAQIVGAIGAALIAMERANAQYALSEL